MTVRYSFTQKPLNGFQLNFTIIQFIQKAHRLQRYTAKLALQEIFFYFMPETANGKRIRYGRGYGIPNFGSGIFETALECRCTVAGNNKPRKTNSRGPFQFLVKIKRLTALNDTKEKCSEVKWSSGSHVHKFSLVYKWWNMCSRGDIETKSKNALY